MYSNYDLESVKSMPLLSKANNLNSYSNSRVSIGSFLRYDSRTNSYRKLAVRKSWKQKLLPEVLEKYEAIVSQGLEWYRNYKQERSTLNGEETPIKQYLVDGKKASLNRRQLQSKIKSLEEQNSNLREELYYLREALLLNFQTRQELK